MHQEGGQPFSSSFGLKTYKELKADGSRPQQNVSCKDIFGTSTKKNWVLEYFFNFPSP